jgi:glycosyltransferase involved in cell wall biosynthesis
MADRRVALVHEWLTVPAGSEEVFAEMCGLYPGPVFGSIIDAERCKFLAGRELHPSFLQNFPYAKKRHFIYSPLMPWAFAKMDMSPYDLILTSSHSFAHGVRKRPGALHIVYYHTPARSLWVPEIDDRASKTFVHRAIASVLRKKDLEASKGPDFLLSNSQTTADRLLKFYGREVTAVIPPPVHTTKWNRVERVSEEAGFLYWGRLIEYKKVDLLIEAVRKTGHKLQIVGSGPMEAQLRAQAADLPHVTFHGRLSDEDLIALMGRCRAVLFAAYEDFGIVPVEAMAAGLPVVALGIGGASETVLPEYGVQFDAQTPEALASAIGRLEGRSFDTAVLRAHAATFDVSEFRRKYRETVERLWAAHAG